MSYSQVSKIDQYIYLGGIPDPKDDSPNTINNTINTPHKIINDLKIGTLISFTGYPVKWKTSSNINRYHVVVQDDMNTNISKFFSKAIEKIHRSVSQKRPVFIHCHAGMSRSVTVLAAYYIKYGIPGKRHPTVNQVLEYIGKNRPCIQPNAGFVKQLEYFYSHLKN